MLGNAVKHLLGLSDDEATSVVYPMPLQTRLKWIYKLGPQRAKSQKARDAIVELKAVMEYIQAVRNTVIHGILLGGGISSDPVQFHLRSKERNIPKDDVLAAEKITTYACIISAHLNWSLADPDKIPRDLLQAPLPERPELPGLVNRPNPTEKK